MKPNGWRRVTVFSASLTSATVFGFGGCGSFNPVSYVSKNACDFLNCDELFWVEDVFPLSERPAMSSGMASGETMDMSEEEEEGGAHMH